MYIYNILCIDTLYYILQKIYIHIYICVYTISIILYTDIRPVQGHHDGNLLEGTAQTVLLLLRPMVLIDSTDSKCRQ